MYNEEREKIAKQLSDTIHKGKTPKLKGEIIGYKIIRSLTGLKEDGLDVYKYYFVKLKVLKSYKRYSYPIYNILNTLIRIETKAEKARVIDIIDEEGNHITPNTPIIANCLATKYIDNWYIFTIYQVGKIVKPDGFDKWDAHKVFNRPWEANRGIYMTDEVFSFSPDINARKDYELDEFANKLKSGEIKWLK